MFLGEEQIKRPGNNGVSSSFLLVAGPLALLCVRPSEPGRRVNLPGRGGLSPNFFFLFLEYVIPAKIFKYNIGLPTRIAKLLLLTVSSIITAKLPRYIICIEKGCVIL